MAKASTSWKKGESGNPNGRPPGTQSFLDRAKHLIDKYKIAEIKEFIGNEEKFNELSVYDGMVMRRIVEAISENGRQSMDSLLDRLLGKPQQYIETKNETTIEHKPVSETVEWLEASLRGGETKPPPKPVLN